KERIVKHLYRGNDKMYKVTQSHGTSYVVNGEHRLALKFKGIADLKQDHTENRCKVSWYKYDDYNGIVKQYKFFNWNEYNIARDFLNKLKLDSHFVPYDH